MHNPFVPEDAYEYRRTTAHTTPYQQPRTGEHMYRATMKPYCVSGVTYYPTTVRVGQKFRGTASWYGPNFHGSLTSNGEYYNMYDYTAAHKTLPINTVVRVTNLQNGKSTTVRINDRGPFVKDRIIDLSYQAAKDLGIIRHGTAQVELEVISFDRTANKYAHKKPLPASTASDNIKTTPPQEMQPKKLYIQKGSFSVQIASFSQKAKAEAFKRKCYNALSQHPIRIKTKKIADKPIYTVLIGGFGSIEEARDYIQKYSYKDAFVVKD